MCVLLHIHVCDIQTDQTRQACRAKKHVGGKSTTHTDLECCSRLRGEEEQYHLRGHQHTAEAEQPWPPGLASNTNGTNQPE